MSQKEEFKGGGGGGSFNLDLVRWVFLLESQL